LDESNEDINAHRNHIENQEGHPPVAPYTKGVGTFILSYAKIVFAITHVLLLNRGLYTLRDKRANMKNPLAGIFHVYISTKVSRLFRMRGAKEQKDEAYKCMMSLFATNATKQTVSIGSLA
jgi:hypothetical protein